MAAEDVEVRLRLETDAGVMRHLGGPRDPEHVRRAHATSLAEAERGACWPFTVQVDGETAGTIIIFPSELDGEAMYEMGWVIDPRLQGRGLASEAAQVMVDAARRESSFGVLHAFPPISNVASNRVCEKVGCELVGELEIDHAGHRLRTNHWRLQLS